MFSPECDGETRAKCIIFISNPFLQTEGDFLMNHCRCDPSCAARRTTCPSWTKQSSLNRRRNNKHTTTKKWVRVGCWTSCVSAARPADAVVQWDWLAVWYWHHWWSHKSSHCGVCSSLPSTRRVGANAGWHSDTLADVFWHCEDPSCAFTYAMTQISIPPHTPSTLIRKAPLRAATVQRVAVTTTTSACERARRSAWFIPDVTAEEVNWTRISLWNLLSYC